MSALDGDDSAKAQKKLEPKCLANRPGAETKSSPRRRRRQPARTIGSGLISTPSSVQRRRADSDASARRARCRRLGWPKQVVGPPPRPLPQCAARPPAKGKIELSNYQRMKATTCGGLSSTGRSTHSVQIDAIASARIFLIPNSSACLLFLRSNHRCLQPSSWPTDRYLHLLTALGSEQHSFLLTSVFG